MKTKLLYLFIVFSLGVSAQTSNRFEGEYQSEGDQYLSIYRNGTFRITNNGLCAGSMADGTYTVLDDTILLTTRFHADKDFPNGSNAISAYYIFLDPVLSVSFDSVGFIFHDGNYQFIREILMYINGSEDFELFQLDSTQMITIPIKKAENIQKVQYDIPQDLPVIFRNIPIIPTRIYHIAKTNPCYPAMTEEKLYFSKGKLYRSVGVLDGKPLLCVFTKYNK